ncbi:MAG: family 14 glycosylhydrolase [bacterium]|nr:family 14 glycosylhydrolase [bacterium]
MKRISLLWLAAGICWIVLTTFAAGQRRAEKDVRRFVRVYTAPASASELAKPAEPGARMVLSFGGAKPEWLSTLRLLGFCLWQYDTDHLASNEVSPGQWDWTAAEEVFEQAKREGFLFALFPHHAFPPRWYIEREKPALTRCVEHNEEIPAISPWEPRFASWLDRQWSALAKQFGGAAPRLDALVLGIHGDYGEAGLFSGARMASREQREDWERRFGDTHNHKGFWCGDDQARVSFRRAMLRKYGDLSALNAAWGTQFTKEEEVRYPRSPAEGRRWWLDFVRWYQNGVTYFTDVVCRLSHRYFPQTLRMLPIGFPNEDVRYGANISALVEVAARHGVAVRSPHAGYLPLAENESFVLARIASACRFYGAPLWLETPGTLDSQRQTEAIFEAITQGASGFFDWAINPATNELVYEQNLRYLTVGKPIVDVAMFFPTTAVRLADIGEAPTMRDGCARARDLFAFDIVDERMIRSGALERYRLLVFWEGTVVEQEVLDRIVEWVQAGGVVVAYDFGKVTNVEGDGAAWRTLFGYAGRLQMLKPTFRGETPAGGYVLRMDDPVTAEFLHGEWSPPEKDNGRTWRWTGSNAQIGLLLKAGQAYSLTLRALLPREAGAVRYEVRFGQNLLGYLDSPGETVYKFVIPGEWVRSDSTFLLSIRAVSQGGSKSGKGVRIEEVKLTALNSQEPPLDTAPKGTYAYQIDQQSLATRWTQKLGKGLCVFVPVRRAQGGVSAYVEVLRRLVYHLSELSPAHRNAPLVDDQADGVFTSLLTDRILFYNSTAQPVTRELRLTREMFSAYPQVQNPPAGTVRVQVPARGMAVVPFSEQPKELLLQCEGFTDLRGQKKRALSHCSPGAGDTCVQLSAGKSIRTRFPVDAPGRYTLFVRCIVESSLVVPRVVLDGKPLQVEDAPVEGVDTLRTETVSLSKGMHVLEIAAPANTACVADFVILTNDAAIRGYRFGRR